MDENELLTVAEMANRLKVKKTWLYSRTMQKNEGAIPFIRIEEDLRFVPADVISWIKKTYGGAK